MNGQLQNLKNGKDNNIQIANLSHYATNNIVQKPKSLNQIKYDLEKKYFDSQNAKREEFFQKKELELQQNYFFIHQQEKHYKKKYQPKDDPQNLGCKCKRSNCLRLNCGCFKALGYCSEKCMCLKCLNTKQNEKQRKEVIEKSQYIQKNCFQEKVKVIQGINVNVRGCICKTGCNKNYCLCRKNKARCTPMCICEQCQNKKLELDRETVRQNHQKRSRKKAKIVIEYGTLGNQQQKQRASVLLVKTRKIKKNIQ